MVTNDLEKEALVSRCMLKLAAARAGVRKKWPWMHSAVLSLDIRVAWGLGTVAATDDYIFLYDPEFVDGVTVPEMTGLFLHEVSHLLRAHIKRWASKNLDTQLGNIAGDIAINQDIRTAGASLPDGGVYPETYGFPLSKTMEEYYALLLQAAQQPPPQPGACDKPQAGQDPGQAPPSPQGIPGVDSVARNATQPTPSKSPGKGGKAEAPKKFDSSKPRAGGGWCGSCAGRPVPQEEGARKELAGRTLADVTRIERQTARAIQEDIDKRAGTVPGSWRVWAEQLLSPPKEDWRLILARLIRGYIGFRKGCVDYTRRRFSRRQAALGFGRGAPILPSMYAPDPRVTLGFDTSASMRRSVEMRLGVQEAAGILEASGSEADFVAFDCAVHATATIRSLQDLLDNLKGGGGTDFRPFIDAVEKQEPRASLAIIVTDGIGPAPATPPSFDVIWLLVGDRSQVPVDWGVVVKVEA